MMRQRERGHGSFLVLLTAMLWILLAFVLPMKSWAVETDSVRRVNDFAELFTAAEADKLQEQITTLREEMNMDVALLTTDDAGGVSSETYADRYYEESGYGVGKNHSGVLLLLDMDNREIYISTEGAMVRFLTDARIETMLDHAVGYMQSGEYAGAAEQMLTDVQSFYRKGIPGGQYIYDRDTGMISRYRSIRWYEGAAAFAAAVFCGAGACAAVKKEYSMQTEMRRAANYHMAYRANAQYQFRNQNDVLADQSVVQNIIVRASHSGGRSGGGHGGGGGGRSTTHRSSGGRSHGGGGRKF